MQLAPNRRWLRFSLRMLFVVVTVLACWLGYELNWVRERRAVTGNPLVQVQDFHLSVWRDFKYGPRTSARTHQQHPVAPWPLDLLGEPGYWIISLPKGTTEQEASRIRRLFPEAERVTVFGIE